MQLNIQEMEIVVREEKIRNETLTNQLERINKLKDELE